MGLFSSLAEGECGGGGVLDFAIAGGQRYINTKARLQDRRPMDG